MACHELIAAELNVLADRLAPQTVDELANGLAETYEHHLTELGDPDQAARATIAEFGDADTITAAFIHASPWRRTAFVLLATGPLMAITWSLTLVLLDLAVPWPLRILYGSAMAMIVTLLALVVRERRRYRRTRPLTLIAVTGLIALDTLTLSLTVITIEAPGWPLALAVPASLSRALFAVRCLALS